MKLPSQRRSKKQHKAHRSLFLWAIIFFSSNIYATELNNTVIKQWMTSQKALQDWGNKHEKQLEKHDNNAQSPNDLSAESMISPLKASGLYDEANSLVLKYGFSSIDQWADVTLRITKAAAAIEFEKQPELTDTSELEALLQNPQISDEHKQMLTAAIQQNKQMVEQITSGTNKKDMEAVSELLPQILQLMNESE